MKIYKVREELSKGKNITNLPLRVTYYARVSTDSMDQLNSLDNQINYFDDYIKSNPNWVFVNGYVDEGISGSTVKGRKNFLKMISDAKDGLFDLIITKEVSRFSRNLADSIKYTQELTYYNVGVFFLTNGINTYDTNSEFILNMMGSVAQEEVKRLSERVKFGHKNAIRNGRVLGSNKITGYIKDDGKLVIEEKEAKFIKLLFEMYTTKEFGLYKLATELFKMGYKNAKGKIYDKCTLVRMLKNPKYKGYYCGQTTRTIDYKTKKREYIDKKDWIIYKDENIPALVSEELWEKANNILKLRSDSFKDKNKTNIVNVSKYAYSGKLYCREHNTTFQRSTGYRSSKRAVWACSYYIKYRAVACHSPIIAEIDLDNIMTDVMKNIFTAKDNLIKEILSYYVEFYSHNSYKEDIIKLESKIGLIHQKKEILLELLVEKHIDGEEFEVKNYKYNNEIKECLAEIGKIQAEQVLLKSSLGDLNNIEQAIKEEFNFKENLKNFVDSFVEEIIISKINNDRKEIKLDIFINLTENISKIKRGSSHLLSLNEKENLILTKKVSTKEVINKKDFIPNNFKYNIYLNI